MGPRVPTLLVSPYVDRGASTDEVFDHTSIGRTILLRFLGRGAEEFGPRMAAATHLGHVMRDTARTDRPRLPSVVAPFDPDEEIPPGGEVPLVPRRRAGPRREFHEAIRTFGRAHR
jgi:hypothetical protein